jgi:hypothetical protein
MRELVLETTTQRLVRALERSARPTATPARRALAFRIPGADASRVRIRLSTVGAARIRRCVPHATDREVTLWIDFEPGMQERLMHVLMTCVPSGQFGRVHAAPAEAALHANQGVLARPETA